MAMQGMRNRHLTFSLPGSFGGPFPFPLCLLSTVKAAVLSACCVDCGDAGAAFFFFGGGVVFVGNFCGVLFWALVFCAGCDCRACVVVNFAGLSGCWTGVSSVSMVAILGWVSDGVASLVVWPSSFRMAVLGTASFPC